MSMKKLTPVSLPNNGTRSDFLRNAFVPICGWGVIISLLLTGFNNLYSTRYGTHILSFLKSNTESFYGPVPHQTHYKAPVYYSFDMDSGFRDFPVNRLNEFETNELHRIILSEVPYGMKKRAKNYIATLFKFSQKMNVDPLWALSIMWTESHFRPNAKSYVNAQGLMQIMPGTVHYLSHKMKRPIGPKLAYKLVKDPTFNMEVGVYYLNYLLNQFDGNYKLATISYNMGPARIRKRLRYGLPVGVKNLYWDKVRRNHKKLTSNLSEILVSTPHPYQLTYVSSPKYWSVTHPSLVIIKSYDLAVRSFTPNSAQGVF